MCNVGHRKLHFSIYHLQIWTSLWLSFYRLYGKCSKLPLNTLIICNFILLIVTLTLVQKHYVHDVSKHIEDREGHVIYICILTYAKQFVYEVKLQSVWLLAKMEGEEERARAQPYWIKSRSCFVQCRVCQEYM